MSVLSKIAGTVSGALNTIAPIAMFIPGMQWVSIAAMVANVASGLAQSPPNWGQIVGNLLTAAIPMGLGKALGAFTGGTATEFAKLFGTKMSETIGEVASKVGNPTFTRLIEQVQSKLGSEAFANEMSAVVSKATGTKPGELLTAEQIGKHLQPIAMGAQGILGNMVGTVINAPLSAASSVFNEVKYGVQTKIATHVSGPTQEELDRANGGPGFRVPPSYRG
jgi:hypothetical protein